MKTLFLIRHGKASLDGSESERGLTDEGIIHATKITEILQNIQPKITKIFSSPFRRAILTIEPLTKATELEISLVEKLREKTTGDKSGSELDIKKMMWEDFDYKLPNGESSNEATSRAITGINEILDNMKDMDVAAIACHGTLIGLILHHYQSEFGFNDWKNMTMPDIYKLTFDKDVIVTHIGCGDLQTFKIGQK
jgi:2,3-bisphosphoglycerate-dependent phosphoglycerate mutase